MSENRCPSCRRELPVADGIFCPYCGAALAKGDELPEPVRAALDAAGKENDPVKKYRLLCDAREAFSDCRWRKSCSFWDGCTSGTERIPAMM